MRCLFSCFILVVWRFSVFHQLHFLLMFFRRLFAGLLSTSICAFQSFSLFLNVCFFYWWHSSFYIYHAEGIEGGSGGSLSPPEFGIFCITHFRYVYFMRLWLFCVGVVVVVVFVCRLCVPIRCRRSFSERHDCFLLVLVFLFFAMNVLMVFI